MSIAKVCDSDSSVFNEVRARYNFSSRASDSIKGIVDDFGSREVASVAYVATLLQYGAA